MEIRLVSWDVAELVEHTMPLVPSSALGGRRAPGHRRKSNTSLGHKKPCLRQNKPKRTSRSLNVAGLDFYLSDKVLQENQPGGHLVPLLWNHGEAICNCRDYIINQTCSLHGSQEVRGTEVPLVP